MEPVKKNIGFRLAIAAMVVLVSGGVLLAQRHPKDYWRGKPAFAPGESSGYFVWQDDDGWHVRWTIRHKGVHSFSGAVSCNGAFKSFQPFRKDGKDYIKQVSENLIRFDTRTGEGVDGADFTLSPSTRAITFDLRMDGRTAPLDAVKVGRDKLRPPGIPFTIDRGPR